MAATIEAARGAFPGRRLVLAFQPHRFTRTRDCFEDFVKVLSGVDALVLADVYSAGEARITSYNVCYTKLLRTTLLWGDLRNLYVWVTLLVTLGFGAVGWVDDWRKVVHRDPKGLASRWKYLWTSVIALAGALILGLTADTPAQTERNNFV